MRARRWFWVFILAGTLSACSTGVEAPEATGPASAEQVALSLAAVDPESSLALFEYDSAAPLDIQEEQRWQEKGSLWIDFTYASPVGGRVPARLVIPNGAGPFPGLILQHGGPGTLEDMDSFAREFARYGAVTIMITSPYRRPGGWFHTQYMGNTWPMFTRRDLEIKIQTILDLRRAVDILEGRSEVDPDRLAYFGVSWGGSMGGLLAGVEDRLKAYVLVVGDGGLVEHTADPGSNGLNLHFSEEWAAMMWPTEPLHFVGRAAPAALLFQNGLYDMFVPPHDALRFYTAASEPKTIIWYDAGHELPWSFVDDAADWLQPYLGDPLLLLAPNYRPGALVAERALLAGILLPFGFFLVLAVRRRTFSLAEGWPWLPVILLLGPFGLGLYWLVEQTHAGETLHTGQAQWRVALWLSTRSAAALLVGVWLGERINELSVGLDFRIRFLQLYLAVLLASGISSLIGRKRWGSTLMAQLLLANAFWVMVVALQAIFWEFFYSWEWARFSTTAALGILIGLPVHHWLLQHGWEWRIAGDADRTASQEQSKTPLAILLAGSFIAIPCVVVLILHRYSGLSWGEALKLLFAGIV